MCTLQEKYISLLGIESHYGHIMVRALQYLCLWHYFDSFWIFTLRHCRLANKVDVFINEKILCQQDNISENYYFNKSKFHNTKVELRLKKIMSYLFLETTEQQLHAIARVIIFFCGGLYM